MPEEQGGPSDIFVEAGLVRGVPTTFWGKLQRDEQNRVSGWHPLADHCADVAAVTEVVPTVLGADPPRPEAVVNPTAPLT